MSSDFFGNLLMLIPIFLFIIPVNFVFHFHLYLNKVPDIIRYVIKLEKLQQLYSKRISYEGRAIEIY